MTFRKRLALAAAMACGVATATPAATLYRLDVDKKDNASSFWVTYEDLDGDTLFSLDELVEWSTYGGRPRLLSVPGGPDAYVDGSGSYWQFKKGSVVVSHHYTHWNYSRSALVSAVPAPAALPLALLGLAALAAVAQPGSARRSR